MLAQQNPSLFPADPGKSESFPTDAASASTAAPGRRLRGSCDFCTKRKRKCDGDGVNRCSFCIAKNQPNCHYSVRLLTGPRADSASRRASKGPPGGKGARATAPTAGGWHGGASGGSGELVSDRRFQAVLPLKRPRLSPSPATGLIGLRENVYIGEFFRTMGFLPFTSESFIRKAMVNTMFRAVQERDPGFTGFPAGEGGGGGGGGGFGEEEGGWGGGAVVPRAGPGDAIESAAYTCVLWCTVAVGCLVGGRPKSSIEGYARLAREALSLCFDDGSAQTARAFTAMALLHNFMGNEDKFYKHIGFAKSIMKALPAEEVPTDLSDTHMFVKACDMLEGFHHRLGEEDLQDAIGAVSGDRAVDSLSKEPRLIQQGDLCRWLLKTDIRMAACFSIDMQNTGFFGESGSDPANCGIDSPHSGAGCEPGGPGSASGPDGGIGDGSSGDLSSSSTPHVVYDDLSPPAGLQMPEDRIRMLRQLSGDTFAAAEPPPPGPMSLKFAAQVLPDVSLMMRATQSPDVRDGVGELYFRSIIAYVCCLQGQQNDAMEGLLRCTDIFLKNPGICRFTAWKHLSHCCLACMHISCSFEKYEELRQSYNSVVDDGGLKAPPFEEFTGMSSICGNVFCKSMYNFFMSIMAAKRACQLEQASSTTSEEESKPSPKIEIQDMDVTSYSSEASDDSWARGAFDKRRQPAAGMEGERSEESYPPASTATPAAAQAAATAELGEASGFAGAFGVSDGKEHHPRFSGADSGFGARAASGGSITASMSSSVSSIMGNSNSVAPAEAGTGGGGAAATVRVAAPPSTAAGQDADRSLYQRGGDGVEPLPLFPSAQSSNSSAATPAPAEVGGDADSNGIGDDGLELLGAADLDGAEAAGLLDAVDALLGEAILEGFGEGGNEGDLTPFFEGNV